MKRAGQLRNRADRYRRLAKTFSDKRAVQAINELATEYEAQATELERLDRVRERAHALWEEQGQPEGLHEAHWREAEHDIAQEDAAPASARRLPRKRA